MIRLLRIARPAIAALLIVAPTALAAGSGKPCAPRAELLENLATAFGEVPKTMGLADGGMVVETFAAESGSWTIIATRPNGISCRIASGLWFEDTGDLSPTGDPA
ncbi:hypothetical protein [Palleronia abyssalis]|uniref:Uncharacterized protein n=1 Tax=Palleronia abyssalis TaxID=1501240 RepID=A0A2R8C1S7_9RHOB|nr:hypothetical protein [Palleronia abyssalis]SPJ26276.1 hypothetical protein PAA8504_04133 [Palleronia abyssalis]